MGRGDDAEITDLHYYLEEASRIAKKLNQEYSKFYDASNYSFKALLEVERIQREREKFKRLAEKSLENSEPKFLKDKGFVKEEE